MFQIVRSKPSDTVEGVIEELQLVATNVMIFRGRSTSSKLLTDSTVVEENGGDGLGNMITQAYYTDRKYRVNEQQQGECGTWAGARSGGWRPQRSYTLSWAYYPSPSAI